MKSILKFHGITIYNDDVLALYNDWEAPDVIISDGGYGVSGFKAISETSTDIQIDKQIQRLKAQIQVESSSSDEEKLEYQAAFLEVVGQLEELWKSIT